MTNITGCPPTTEESEKVQFPNTLFPASLGVEMHLQAKSHSAFRIVSGNNYIAPAERSMTLAPINSVVKAERHYTRRFAVIFFVGDLAMSFS
ncbi:hypothetical protein [Geopsychrobacter electrodiphilus]|uniref:hypothetical protein n=1 Tax=Geopsychrobacter electrodiphilus TaxID=225196 RepID=UPI000369FF07|nr:hypothetical protein [Geopsychrobacter electrodiphilus]